MSDETLEGPIYVDSSALIKIYLPETESKSVDRLVSGRTDLLISELVITEIVSILARLRREGALTAENVSAVYSTLLEEIEAGQFGRIVLSPETHRLAERLLLLSDAVPLRSLDALHLALAMEGQARAILTFDRRMAEAAVISGLRPVTRAR